MASILAGAAAIFAILVLITAPSSGDYVRACEAHGRVQQIVGFNLSVKSATVVCKDGTVWVVK